MNLGVVDMGPVHHCSRKECFSIAPLCVTVPDVEVPVVVSCVRVTWVFHIIVSFGYSLVILSPSHTSGTGIGVPSIGIMSTLPQPYSLRPDVHTVLCSLTSVF